jgi:hypothetical protein
LSIAVALLGFEHHFIDVAPEPILAGLNGLNNRMFRSMKMLGGVLVFGTVAAADVAALLAEPEMDPGVAHFEAFFAAVNFRFNVANLIGVRTDVSHCASSVLDGRFDGNSNFKTSVAGS